MSNRTNLRMSLLVMGALVAFFVIMFALLAYALGLKGLSV